MIGSWTADRVDGYCTAWPARDFGTDKVAAILATKVRGAEVQWTARPSYVALYKSSNGVALRSRTIEQARLESIARSGGDPVLLCLRIAVVPNRLLRKVEQLLPSDAGEYVVAPSGHVVEKVTNPWNPFDFRGMINKLASGLRTADQSFVRPQLQQYFDRLMVDWPNLTPQQIERVLIDARAYLGTLPIDPLVGEWNTRITIKLEEVGEITKKIIRQTFLPSVQLSLALEEREAVAQIGRQAGFFVRDEYGRRSAQLTNRVRNIVKSGLKEGFGRNEIAKQIVASGNGYWAKRGLNYARVVAANSVSRARSYSELVSYLEVGIEQLEVQAVLDERTTEYCRTIDGSIISVSSAWDHQQQINQITNPEDIGKVAPFFRMGRNEENGNRQVLTGSGKVFAEVTRSGVGTANDRGDYKQFMGADRLAREGVTMPPYHHACRTFTVPRTSYVQVPSGYSARTYAQPVTQPTRGSAPAQRPSRMFQSPTASSPQEIINPEPPTQKSSSVVKEDRTVSGILNETMNSILVVLGTEAIRLGRDLTKEETGKQLRSVIELQVGTPFSGKSIRVATPTVHGLPFRTYAMDNQLAWKIALQFAGPKIRDAVRFRELPAFRRGTQPGYYRDRKLIVVRSINDDEGIVRYGQKFIDTLGDHMIAGNALRNARALPGPLIRVSEESFAIQGAWIDVYDGKVDHQDDAWLIEQYASQRPFTIPEIHRSFYNVKDAAFWEQVAPRFLKGHEVELGTNWERCPEQVVGFIALQAGEFLEVSSER